MPGEKSVCTSRGDTFTNIFTRTAVDDMRERFLTRNTGYRDRQLEIIENILIPTEHVLMQVYGKEEHNGGEPSIVIICMLITWFSKKKKIDHETTIIHSHITDATINIVNCGL